MILIEFKYNGKLKEKMFFMVVIRQKWFYVAEKCLYAV